MTPEERKRAEWDQFAQQIEKLGKGGKRALRKLSAEELSGLLDNYQSLNADLARARSFQAPNSTIAYLNELAVAAHSVLYAYSQSSAPLNWRTSYDIFARSVRAVPQALILSNLMFWIPLILAFFTVQLNPIMAVELVPPEFYNFEPPSADHMHEIPQLTRPLVATSIMANNIQVTLLLFALGLTCGLGTTAVLIFNGVHIGAVAGWMTYQGQGRAILGWILPHGSTELIAIILAGTAGYVLADAILAPGLLTRAEALKKAGLLALKIEVGCMLMLVVAGLIEGLVSPSSIGFGPRLLILVSSVTLWLVYFSQAGREGDEAESSLNPANTSSNRS